MSAIISQDHNPILLTSAPGEFFQHWLSGIQALECDLDCSDSVREPRGGDCCELQSRISSNDGIHSVVELLLVRDLAISLSLASWSPHCIFTELTATLNDLTKVIGVEHSVFIFSLSGERNWSDDQEDMVQWLMESDAATRPLVPMVLQVFLAHHDSFSCHYFPW